MNALTGPFEKLAEVSKHESLPTPLVMHLLFLYESVPPLLLGVLLALNGLYPIKCTLPNEVKASEPFANSYCFEEHLPTQAWIQLFICQAFASLLSNVFWNRRGLSVIRHYYNYFLSYIKKTKGQTDGVSFEENRYHHDSEWFTLTFFLLFRLCLILIFFTGAAVYIWASDDFRPKEACSDHLSCDMTQNTFQCIPPIRILNSTTANTTSPSSYSTPIEVTCSNNNVVYYNLLFLCYPFFCLLSIYFLFVILSHFFFAPFRVSDFVYFYDRYADALKFHEIDHIKTQLTVIKTKTVPGRSRRYDSLVALFWIQKGSARYNSGLLLSWFSELIFSESINLAVTSDADIRPSENLLIVFHFHRLNVVIDDFFKEYSPQDFFPFSFTSVKQALFSLWLLSKTPYIDVHPAHNKGFKGSNQDEIHSIITLLGLLNSSTKYPGIVKPKIFDSFFFPDFSDCLSIVESYEDYPHIRKASFKSLSSCLAYGLWSNITENSIEKLKYPLGLQDINMHSLYLTSRHPLRLGSSSKLQSLISLSSKIVNLLESPETKSDDWMHTIKKFDILDFKVLRFHHYSLKPIIHSDFLKNIPKVLDFYSSFLSGNGNTTTTEADDIFSLQLDSDAVNVTETEETDGESNESSFSPERGGTDVESTEIQLTETVFDVEESLMDRKSMILQPSPSLLAASSSRSLRPSQQKFISETWNHIRFDSDYSSLSYPRNFALFRILSLLNISISRLDIQSQSYRPPSYSPSHIKELSILFQNLLDKPFLFPKITLPFGILHPIQAASLINCNLALSQKQISFNFEISKFRDFDSGIPDEDLVHLDSSINGDGSSESSPTSISLINSLHLTNFPTSSVPFDLPKNTLVLLNQNLTEFRPFKFASILTEKNNTTIYFSPRHPYFPLIINIFPHGFVDGLKEAKLRGSSKTPPKFCQCHLFLKLDSSGFATIQNERPEDISKFIAELQHSLHPFFQ